MQTQFRPITKNRDVSSRTRSSIGFHARGSSWMMALVVIIGMAPVAQAQVLRATSDAFVELPAPPNDFEHHEMYEGSFVDEDAAISVRDSRSAAPHQILRPPAMNPLRVSSPGHVADISDVHAATQPSRHSQASANAKRMLDETLHTDGPVLRHLHEHKQPAQATIPEATVEPRWKAPYAYGYFGASGTRGWTKSYGYRETYKRWTKQ